MTEATLFPILDEEGAITREARRRGKDHEFSAVSTDRVDQLVTEGWEIDRRLKKRTRLRKLKSVEERLENRFWMLLYRMGYSELSEGRRFTVRFKRSGNQEGEKQIDVFARDGQTVVVAECKASRELKRRSLQKDIEEFANLKGPIANAIKKYYGNQYKPKILWVFVTENIIWSPEDLKRARGENISRITERELRYFSQITDHLGPAARYQFHAEFFAGQEIPELQSHQLPAIRGRLGKHKFFCFVATPEILLPISFVNHRSLNDPDGVPTYQRLVQKSRLKKIATFIRDGGYFPTNILINFNTRVRFDIIRGEEKSDVHFGTIYLPAKYKSAWIIDGQHRIYGYSGLDKKFLSQNILILAFENMPTVEEANLFVTINHEQKSVPRNLLDDLEGELKWGSGVPGERIKAISSRLINILNTDQGEPFYNRIAQQGIRSTRETCLTIPALMDGLRRSGLVGRVILKNKTYDIGHLSSSTDNKTLDRARSALNLYFDQIREKNWSRWAAGTDGLVCTNTGVQAHFRLLGDLADHLEKNTSQDPIELEPQELIEQILPLLKPVLDFIGDADDQAFSRRFKVSYGSRGPTEYFFRLVDLIRERNSDFQPSDYLEWKNNQQRHAVTDADGKVKEINSIVCDLIFSKFIEMYGSEKNLYWEKGVTDKEMKARAYQRSLEDPVEERAPLESYLSFIDYKKIVEKSENWPLFKESFDIPLPGDKGLAKNIRWMDRMNDIRRIPAHQTVARTYKNDDLDIIELVHGRLVSQSDTF